MGKRTLLLFLIGVILTSGCTDTNTSTETTDSAVVKQGDYVSVDYIGELEDGTVFDTSLADIAIEAGLYNPDREYKPLGFTVGAGQMIAGFDSGVVGMAVGENKTVIIPPEEAYGPHYEELVKTFPIEEIEQLNITPMVGTELNTRQGQKVIITNVSETEVSIDFNHRLAGKTLVFKIELVSIGQD